MKKIAALILGTLTIISACSSSEKQNEENNETETTIPYDIAYSCPILAEETRHLITMQMREKTTLGYITKLPEQHDMLLCLAEIKQNTQQALFLICATKTSDHFHYSSDYATLEEGIEDCRIATSGTLLN